MMNNLINNYLYEVYCFVVFRLVKLCNVIGILLGGTGETILVALVTAP